MANANKRGAGAASSAWHCVTIRPGTFRCPALQGLGEQRFLPDKAPRLPLPACSDADRCQCRYQHHADRRAGPRREGDGGLAARRTTPAGERRRPGERRAPK